MVTWVETDTEHYSFWTDDARNLKYFKYLRLEIDGVNSYRAAYSGKMIDLKKDGEFCLAAMGIPRELCEDCWLKYGQFEFNCKGSGHHTFSHPRFI